MADLVIRGMAMPENCGNCFFCDDWAKCQLLNLNNIFDYCKDGIERPVMCPLVEIKTPYGRLIDADALHKLFMEYAKTSGDKSASWAFLFCANVIKIVKPIVDAEGGGEDGNPQD